MKVLTIEFFFSLTGHRDGVVLKLTQCEMLLEALLIAEELLELAEEVIGVVLVEPLHLHQQLSLLLDLGDVVDGLVKDRNVGIRLTSSLASKTFASAAELNIEDLYGLLHGGVGDFGKVGPEALLCRSARYHIFGRV